MKDFAKDNPSYDIDRLNLSYSRDDSTLNELLFISGPRSIEPTPPLQLGYFAEFKK